MSYQDHLGIIPSQHTGKEIESRASKTLDTEITAKEFFELAKQRLLDVNNWNKIAGMITAAFYIIDKNGNDVKRNVEKNDYLKINIPGPGNSEGDGYDWVQVEELKEISNKDFQSIGFRVRPTDNPFSEKSETAHFYSNEATSSFIVNRNKKRIEAIIIDRNLLPNKESGSIVDKARDLLVGVGAIAGLSKIQWQGLADGLLAQEI